MTLLYASVQDLQDWDTSTPVPDNAARLVRSASMLVGNATIAARYAVDVLTGLPAVASTLAAFRDATVAHAYSWELAQIDPANEGIMARPQVITKKTMPGASLDFSDHTANQAMLKARVTSIGLLCNESMNILLTAGLLNGQPGTSYDQFGFLYGMPIYLYAQLGLL